MQESENRIKRLWINIWNPNESKIQCQKSRFLEIEVWIPFWVWNGILNFIFERQGECRSCYYVNGREILFSKQQIMVFFDGPLISSAARMSASTISDAAYNKQLHRSVRLLYEIFVQPHTLTIDESGCSNTTSLNWTICALIVLPDTKTQQRRTKSIPFKRHSSKIAYSDPTRRWDEVSKEPGQSIWSHGVATASYNTDTPKLYCPNDACHRRYCTNSPLDVVRYPKNQRTKELFSNYLIA